MIRGGWRAVVCVLAVGAALAGCRDPLSIEERAWTSAGVDQPAFARTGDVLDVRADTSLPVDEAADTASGFAARVGQIVWRTRAEPFTSLRVFVLHDGVEVVTFEYGRADLEAWFGPRPDGLDTGVARARTEQPASGPDAPPATVDAAQQLLEQALRRTLDEHYGSATEIRFGAPAECKTGLNGNEPTGTYRVSATAEPLPVGGSGLAALPGVAQFWGTLGLAADTARFDNGLDSVSAGVAERVKLTATARDDTVRLSGNIDCVPR